MAPKLGRYGHVTLRVIDGAMGHHGATNEAMTHAMHIAFFPVCVCVCECVCVCVCVCVRACVSARACRHIIDERAFRRLIGWL